MRKFKVVLIVLAASAVILVPAEGSGAATRSAPDASPSSPCIMPCFSMYDDDIIVAQYADVITVATYCGVPVSVLMLISVGTFIDCGNHKKIKRVPCPPCNVRGLIAPAAGRLLVAV